MLFAPVERRQPCPAAYVQIVQQVIRALHRGELAPGGRLPSIRSTAAAARVHANTAQRAVTALVGLGVLEIHRGRGIFVREVQPQRSPDETVREATAALIQAARATGIGLPVLLDLLSAEWASQHGVT